MNALSQRGSVANSFGTGPVPLFIWWDDGDGCREAMIFAVLSGKAQAICLRSLCGEGSDGGREPERLTIEDNGGVFVRCRAEHSPILAYGILYCALDVGHLH